MKLRCLELEVEIQAMELIIKESTHCLECGWPKPLHIGGCSLKVKEDMEKELRANDRQIGGEHYMKYGDLQPWDTWWIWNLNGFQAAILKHVVRYRDKAGLQDLEKAKHYLDKLIELEREKARK